MSAAQQVPVPQEVVPLDGQAFEGALVWIDPEDGVGFEVGRSGVAEAIPPTGARPASEAGAPLGFKIRSLRFDELVRWGHPVAPRPHTLVVLPDGGALVTAADWAGGAPVRFDSEGLVVLSDTFGERPLPARLVRGIVFAQRHHAAERAELVERVRSFDGKEDAVFLTNGDRLLGSVEELAGGSLTIATTAGQAKLPVSRVEALALRAKEPSPGPSLRGRGSMAVGLRDGSVLRADALRGDADGLVLELAGGVTLSGGSIEDVVALQSLEGPFVYLSDLEAADYRHVPYLSVEWPYERDRNVLGGPLVVGGERYLKGIGMHSASRLTYRLGGEYRRLDAAVAVDDSAEGRGSVTFGVYLLRDGQWTESYNSGVLRGGDPPQPVSVDVSGADGLTLTVDYADRGDELDRADWLDARLVKEQKGNEALR